MDAEMHRNFHYGEVFAAVVAMCRPLGRFAKPWDDLDPPDDCYGPVADPGRALTQLRERFGDRRLMHCGVIRTRAGGRVELAPELTRQGTVVVALRTHPARAPFALLAGGRCLPTRRCPVRAAYRDYSLAAGLIGGELLLAAADTRDVAILRALGLPCTLAGPIRPPSRAAFAYLDIESNPLEVDVDDDYAAIVAAELAEEAARTRPPAPVPECGGETKGAESDANPVAAAGPDPRPRPDSPPTPPIPPTPSPSAAAPEPAEDTDPRRRVVALVAWSPAAFCDRVPTIIAYAARRLRLAQLGLDLAFAGVMVWTVDGDTLEEVRNRLRFANLAAVAARLAESITESTTEFDSLLAEPPPPPLDFVEARAALVTTLANPAGTPDALVAAWVNYNAALERELVAPLRAAALRRPDLVARVAGVDVANTAGLVFQSAVFVEAAIAHQVAGRGGVPDPAVSKQLARHLAQVDKFHRLLGATVRVFGRFS